MENEIERENLGDSKSAKFKPYTMRMVWYGQEPFNPKDEVIDVRLHAHNREYSANFTTLECIRRLTEKNVKSGECLKGTYFAMPGLVIVKELERGIILRTIDDFIKNEEIHNYFLPIK